MRKFINTIAFMAIAMFTFSCTQEKEKEVVVDNTPPIHIKVSAAQADQNSPFLTTSGKIQAANSTEISTRMMGFVTKIYANVGDKVKKGQVLITINNTDLLAKRAQINASIAEATAALNHIQKDYTRYENLFKEKSATQKELDDLRSNLEMAKARLEGANQMKNEINAQFAYANIQAPFTGVVTGKLIESGEMANPGMPLMSIETPGDYEVIAMVPENEISQIKTGNKVDVIVKSIGKTIKGQVAEVSPSAKNTGGQYLVKISLGKTDPNILSGMFASVQFPVSKSTAASGMVLIPNEVIVTKGQLSGIYTVSESNTALLRWLRLGRTFGNNVEVLSGLAINEPYITSAEGKLFNGAKVSIQ